MGGWGSTRWRGHSTKCRVEDALVLDAGTLVRGAAIGEANTAGSIRWWWPTTGKVIAEVGFWLETEGDERCLCLHYALSGQVSEPKVFVTRVSLVTSKQHFGGLRYWLICPTCEGRAHKLYLTTENTFFRCRRCSGLTYKSCQESHRFDRFDGMIAAELGTEVKNVRRAFRFWSLPIKERRRLVRRKFKTKLKAHREFFEAF
jgi:hypothetical protein